MIVGRLQKCVAGQIDMTPTQIAAARILLNKVLPDLKALEVQVSDQVTGDARAISTAFLLSVIEGQASRVAPGASETTPETPENG